jgi:hypothetical protein
MSLALYIEFALLLTPLLSPALADAGGTSLGNGTGPYDPACIQPDPTSLCFQQRVNFFEGLILFGVLLSATLCGLTCMSALKTPTKFLQPKERIE